MPVSLQAAGAASSLPGGYGAALLQAVLALGAVCLLAWVVLRWLGRRGFGTGASGGGRVRVLERAPLDAQRALYLVQVGERIWLLGAGQGAAPSLVAEIDPADLPPLPASPGKPFSEFMTRLSKKRGAP